MSSAQLSKCNNTIADPMNQHIYEQFIHFLSLHNYTKPNAENINDILQDLLTMIQQQQTIQTPQQNSNIATFKQSSISDFAKQNEVQWDSKLLNNTFSETEKNNERIPFNNLKDLQTTPFFQLLIFLIISIQNETNTEYLNKIFKNKPNQNTELDHTISSNLDLTNYDQNKLQQLIQLRDIKIDQLNEQLEQQIHEQDRIQKENNQLKQEIQVIESRLNELISYLDTQTKTEKSNNYNNNNDYTNHHSSEEENFQQENLICYYQKEQSNLIFVKNRFISFGLIKEKENVDMICKLENKLVLVKQKIQTLCNKKQDQIDNLQSEIEKLTRNSDSNISSISGSSNAKSLNKSIILISPSQSLSWSQKRISNMSKIRKAYSLEINNQGSAKQPNESALKQKSQLFAYKNQRASSKEKSSKRVTYQQNQINSKLRKNSSFSSLHESRKLKKKSSFYRNIQKETSKTNADDVCKPIVNTDFLGIKNSPLITKIMKRKVTETNSEDVYFFSDQVYKYSHSSQKQERIICLDQTYFYVINHKSTLNEEFKKFPLREINKIIISSKNQQLCSLHIKKEFELIIEIERRESLIQYISNIFSKIFQVDPPTIQTSSNERETEKQSVINNLRAGQQNQNNTQSIKTKPDDQSLIISDLKSLESSPILLPNKYKKDSILHDEQTPKFSEVREKLLNQKQQQQNETQEVKKQTFKVLYQKNNSFIKRLFGDSWQNGLIQIDGEISMIDGDINSEDQQPIKIISLDKNLVNSQQVFQFSDSQNNKYLIKLQQQFDSPLLIAKLNQKLQQA